MDLNKSYEFFKPELMGLNSVHIIGVGAIGATVAENLVRFGITNIHIWDFDTVCSHNVANQIYTGADIDKMKVDALYDYLIKINPECENSIIKHPEGWHGEKLDGYVVLAVDSISLRRDIVNANKYNMNVIAFFDYRMGLTDAQHFAADWRNPDEATNFLATMDFTSEEAKEQTPVSACNMTLSVCPTVRAIVAYGVANMINFIKDGDLKHIIFLDAFKYNLFAE